MNPTSGDTIRSTRQARGFSQEFVARILGIPQQSYSTLEKTPEKYAYQKMIDHLEEEIEFLRKFLEQKGKSL